MSWFDKLLGREPESTHPPDSEPAPAPKNAPSAGANLAQSTTDYAAMARDVGITAATFAPMRVVGWAVGGALSLTTYVAPGAGLAVRTGIRAGLRGVTTLTKISAKALGNTRIGKAIGNTRVGGWIGKSGGQLGRHLEDGLKNFENGMHEADKIVTLGANNAIEAAIVSSAKGVLSGQGIRHALHSAATSASNEFLPTAVATTVANNGLWAGVKGIGQFFRGAAQNRAAAEGIESAATTATTQLTTGAGHAAATQVATTAGRSHGQIVGAGISALTYWEPVTGVAIRLGMQGTLGTMARGATRVAERLAHPAPTNPTILARVNQWTKKTAGKAAGWTAQASENAIHGMRAADHVILLGGGNAVATFAKGAANAAIHRNGAHLTQGIREAAKDFIPARILAAGAERGWKAGAVESWRVLSGPLQHERGAAHTRTQRTIRDADRPTAQRTATTRNAEHEMGHSRAGSTVREADQAAVRRTATTRNAEPGMAHSRAGNTVREADQAPIRRTVATKDAKPEMAHSRAEKTVREADQAAPSPAAITPKTESFATRALRGGGRATLFTAQAGLGMGLGFAKIMGQSAVAGISLGASNPTSPTAQIGRNTRALATMIRHRLASANRIDPRTHAFAPGAKEKADRVPLPNTRPRETTRTRERQPSQRGGLER